MLKILVWGLHLKEKISHTKNKGSINTIIMITNMSITFSHYLYWYYTIFKFNSGCYWIKDGLEHNIYFTDHIFWYSSLFISIALLVSLFLVVVLLHWENHWEKKEIQKSWMELAMPWRILRINSLLSFIINFDWN